MTFLVNIDVPDVERGAAFYADAFGLTRGRRLGADFLELLAGPAPIYLLANPAGSTPAPGAAPRDYARHWTPVHIDFVVDDAELEAVVERAVRAGATVERPIAEKRYGRIAVLADPFGNGF